MAILFESHTIVPSSMSPSSPPEISPSAPIPGEATTTSRYLRTAIKKHQTERRMNHDLPLDIEMDEPHAEAIEQRHRRRSKIVSKTSRVLDPRHLTRKVEVDLDELLAEAPGDCYLSGISTMSRICDLSWADEQAWEVCRTAKPEMPRADCMISCWRPSAQLKTGDKALICGKAQGYGDARRGQVHRRLRRPATSGKTSWICSRMRCTGARTSASR